MEATVIDKVKENKVSCHQPAPTRRGKWNYEELSKSSRPRATEKSGWKPKKLQVITVISPLDEKYKKAKERIDELCQDLADVSAPNETAQYLALRALELLKENALLPTLINSSHDESLVFEFFVKNDAYSFDFYNDGETLYGSRVEGKIPHIAEIKNEERLIEAISEISHAYANL